MMEKECISTSQGMVYYKAYKTGIEVLNYSGRDEYLSLKLLQTDCGKNILSIGKKAFLSCKSLETVVINEELEEIGDWAFAYCRSLKKVQLPSKNIRFGKEVFKDCEALEELVVGETDKDKSEAGNSHPHSLLAAAVVLLKEPLLLHSRPKEQTWYQQFDKALLGFIRMDDKEGLLGNVVGGEEEYGTQEQDLQLFMHQKRMEKVRLIYLRMHWDDYMTETTKECLKTYLLEHTIGKSSCESWQVLLEHESHPAYHRIFLEAGCFHLENYQEILQAIDASNPEMKAVFMKYKNDMLGYEDFFEGLDL